MEKNSHLLYIAPYSDRSCAELGRVTLAGGRYEHIEALGDSQVGATDRSPLGGGPVGGPLG